MIGIKDLNERGYFTLPSLDKQKCDSIVKQLEKHTFKASHHDHTIKGLDYNSALHNTYNATDQRLIMQIPEINELSHDPKILAIVEEYLGGKPIQTQANCWWSVNHTKAEGPQKFHQDGTYDKFIKLFLYLNDVGMENGPHTYVPESLNRMVTPQNYRMSSRVKDDFIYENYSEIKYFTGEKGTMNLIDTSAYHKGLPVKKGHRLILQFEWTDNITNVVTGKSYTNL